MDNEAVLSELLAALGSENNDAQWMLFMSKLEEYLPFAANSGRPSVADIENSIVGQLGFTTLKEFIESERALNWSYDSYKVWKNMWSLVQRFPFLKEMDVSASFIKTNRKLLESERPSTREEFEQCQVALAHRLEAEKQETIATLKANIEKLEEDKRLTSREFAAMVQSKQMLEKLLQQSADDNKERDKEINRMITQLLELRDEADELRVKFAAESKQKSELLQNNQTLESELSKKSLENESLVNRNNELSGTLKALKNMSRWEHFKAFLAGKA